MLKETGMRSVTCLILPRSRHSIMSMARGRNSRFIIAVSMDELFANCETILDSLYISILLDPTLFVFQNFSFIIFLTLLDVIGLVWFCFFFNYDSQIEAPVEKNTVTCLLIPLLFLFNSWRDNFVYKCIFQFSSWGYAVFWILCLYITWDKAEFLGTSSNRIDFNTLSFQ